MDNEPQEFNWEPLEFKDRTEKTIESTSKKEKSIEKVMEEIENSEATISTPEIDDIVIPWEAEEAFKKETEEPVVKTSYFSKPGKKKAIDETIARFDIREKPNLSDTQDVELPKSYPSGQPEMIFERPQQRPENPVFNNFDSIQETGSSKKTLKEKVLPIKGDSKNTLIKKGVAMVLVLTLIICSIALTILYGRVSNPEITPQSGVVMTEDEVLRQEEEKDREEPENDSIKESENSNERSSNQKKDNNTDNRDTGSKDQPVIQ